MLVQHEHGEKWQRHVTAVLWTSIGILILMAAAMVYSAANGFFSPPAQNMTSSWPLVWP